MIGSLLARRNLAEALQALNRHDLDSFMSAWSQDSVFEYPGDVPASGTYRGREAVTAWFRRFLDQFPIIEFQPRNICLARSFDFFGTNVGAIEWHIRLVNRHGRELLNSGVSMVGMVNGKVTFVKDYIFNVGDTFRGAWEAPAAAHEAQHA